MSELRDREDACCEDWGKHIRVLDGYMQISRFQAFMIEWDGAPFRFCPWCGEGRMKDSVALTDEDE